MKANRIKIYGASDDLIEVEDEQNGLDEHGSYSPKHVRFSDGTRLRCEYAPDGYGGNWKIDVVKVGTATILHTPVDLKAEDPEPHSDVVELSGEGLHIVSVGTEIEPTRKEIAKALEDFDASDYSDDQLKRIYAITKEV